MPASPHTNELQRRIENILRAGTIAEIDHDAARVRVATGDLRTDWLPWLEQRAGNIRTWCPPSVGEQCLILSPGGDLAAGIVITGIASAQNPSPASAPGLHRTQYPDGTTIDYDHAAHALTVNIPAGGSVNINTATATLTASDSVTIDTPQTTITGQCTVQGLLTYQAGMAGSGGAGAAAIIQGTVQVSDDVTAAGISLKTHRHSGVQSGGSTSGGPV